MGKKEIERYMSQMSMKKTFGEMSAGMKGLYNSAAFSRLSQKGDGQAASKAARAKREQVNDEDLTLEELIAQTIRRLEREGTEALKDDVTLTFGH